MTHDGKVVVDTQGRIMGKDGKLMKDKEGKFMYINDKENKKRGSKMADSGETARPRFFQKAMKDPNRIPVTKKNAGGKVRQGSGDWSANDMAAWQGAKNK